MKAPPRVGGSARPLDCRPGAFWACAAALLLTACRDASPYGAHAPAAYAVPAALRAVSYNRPCQERAACGANLYGIGGTCEPFDSQGYYSAAGRDEYLCDGGDQDPEVLVRPDGRMDGLDPEDAIAHFDTIDGETHVEPTSRVCIYAPRFAAVRQVLSPEAHLQADQPLGVVLPDAAVEQEGRQLARYSVQRDAPRHELVTSRLTTFDGSQKQDVLSGRLAAMQADEELLAHANLQFLVDGVLRQSEKARVVRGMEASVSWTHDQSVQVVINDEAAVAVVGDQQAQATYVVEWLPGKPRLRVVKLASTNHAEVGEEVEFIIRFDNLGSQALRRVVIADRLTPRLAYVQGSAEGSPPGALSHGSEEDGSLWLRWELTDPLPAGSGGVLTFRCRVR